MEKYVLRFSEIRKQDVVIAGGKGANLSEMVRAGFPVPLGAVVTADAYGRFMEENGISISISSLILGLLVWRSRSIGVSMITHSLINFIGDTIAHFTW